LAVRRAVALGVAGVALVAPGTARADGEAVTLQANRQTTLSGNVVRFSGSATPASQGIRVHLYRRIGTTWRRIARLQSAAGGSFRASVRLWRPGRFIGRASFPVHGGEPIVVGSRAVRVRIKPRLTTRFVGSSVVGHRLFLRGQLRPATAGALKRTVRGVTRGVRLRRGGGFKIKLPTATALPVRIRLHLRPAGGYVGRQTIRRKRLALPYLGSGSYGPAVRALDRQLKRQQYALRSANKSYGTDTAQAVLAFQKVHGLSRTGRVTPRLWRLLARSKTPRARVRKGNHIEILKAKQVIYEVGRGRVRNVLHTSTGATGNTPVGRWRVYSKVPGFNASHMYYSLFFLRGFAIHGYHSVPAWPASHGCARIPIWAAPGLYSRWGYGSRIIVFA
jgi:hypothetical protein